MVTVLSVSTMEEDVASLRLILARTPWTLGMCRSMKSALRVLQQGQVAIILCDRDGELDAWQTMLAECQRVAQPPCLIVTSRRADERLWAEALNLGAYDVLAKPFDAKEVMHVVGRGIRHWSTPAPMPLEPALQDCTGTAAA